MSTILTPRVGENRLPELTSEETSPDTKGWAARWYAEMMITLFLSEEAKKRTENFKKLPLDEKIREISKDYSGEIIDSLNLIKTIGNNSSHFQEEETTRVTKEEAEKAARKAMELFDLILVNLLKDGGLAKTTNTAKIFSTLPPSIRANVLSKIHNPTSFNSGCEYDVGVLHKYILALTKSGKREKAREIIKKLRKRKKISSEQFEFWGKSINEITRNIETLPIAQDINDCRRNFEEAIKQVSNHEKTENSELIRILNILLDEVTPSEIGTKVGDQFFLIDVSKENAADLPTNTSGE